MSIETLVVRVAELEARVNELSPPPNPSRVTPDGIYANTRFNDENAKPYYDGWATQSAKNYEEFAVSDVYVKNEYGSEMFDGIYYLVSHMTALDKLKMLSSHGTKSDLSLLPDLSKIRNCSVKEMRICSEFEFIPYLGNFPSLLRLEIMDHPTRPSNTNKKQQIYNYCIVNGITILCT